MTSNHKTDPRADLGDLRAWQRLLSSLETYGNLSSLRLLLTVDISLWLSLYDKSSKEDRKAASGQAGDRELENMPSDKQILFDMMQNGIRNNMPMRQLFPPRMHRHFPPLKVLHLC